MPATSPGTLDRALALTQNDAGVTGTVGFQDITSQIDAGNVVGARVSWNGGGAHFVAIYGYATIADAPWVSVDDPISGKSQVLLTDFQNNYEGSGTWTDTYYTKAYTPNMPFKTLQLPEAVAQHIQEKSVLLNAAAGGLPQAASAVATSKLSLGLAHPTYTVGLDALKAGRAKPQRAGTRVFEMEADRLHAMFELADEPTPSVRQASTTSPYLQHFPRAMELALADTPAAEQAQREVRLLQIPALNFHALWLHGQKSADDRVIPFRNFHGFTAFSVVPYKEAMTRLRQAAQQAVPQDDKMGA